jgi:hypothetical protein
MIYTQYNTQNYYQQNTWSKPPLLPRLTEKKIFKTLKPMISDKKKRSFKARMNFITNSTFAEEIWSQLDKPP